MLSNTAVPREYAKFRDAVIKGEIPVNKEISMQMNRIDYLIRSPEFYYNDKAIDGFINFCENEMTLTDGGDLKLLPTFKLWAEDLLAWYYYKKEKFYNQHTRRMDERVVLKRLRNKQYLIVGRGAAKSLYDSMIQAYFDTVDQETTQQWVVAPTMKQAEEIMSPIKTAMARHRGPLLTFYTAGNKLSVNKLTKQKLASTKKGIENFLTNSIIEIKPMSIDKLQGGRPKVSTVDEWLSGTIREDVIGAIEQGASKINDYIIVATSSEGTVRDGPGDTIKMELMDILRGDYYDPHTSIWYYRLDDVSEVGHPELWLKANPNLGATVSYETYERDVHRAESQPATRNDILAKRFGIPVEGFTYFFTYEETLPHGAQDFDGLSCAMGADLSQGDDFCAFTFIFPLGYERFGVKTRAYVSRNKVNKLQRAMQNRYEDFVKEGTLIILDGGVLNVMDIFDDLDSFIMDHKYVVECFGYDPYNAKEFVDKWCEMNGEFGVSKVIQGTKTESVPLGELKNLAEERNLIFDQELMKFGMGNAVAIEDNNGNYKLSKKRAEEKIDPVSAMLDAWVAYKRNQEVFE